MDRPRQEPWLFERMQYLKCAFVKEVLELSIIRTSLFPTQARSCVHVLKDLGLGVAVVHTYSLASASVGAVPLCRSVPQEEFGHVSV